MNVKQAVPFFMVANMERSLEFYVGGLGFELKLKWEPRGRTEWCWLDLDEASIMLQEYRTEVPDILGAGVSICFMCEDALEIYRDLVERGVAPDEPFVGNHLWVVGVRDPDNYLIVFESPTEVPEETTYSEWSDHNAKMLDANNSEASFRDMGVYVDKLLYWPNGTGFWKDRKFSHMIADSVPELLAIARSIGLDESWLQNKGVPHFGLTEGKRYQALRKGAVELDLQRFAEKMREIRDKKVPNE